MKAKNVALLVPGVGAAVAAALIGSAQASADAPYVVGEPYARAVAILQADGKASAATRFPLIALEEPPKEKAWG